MEKACILKKPWQHPEARPPAWDWESFYSKSKVKQQERRRMLSLSQHNLLEQGKQVGYRIKVERILVKGI